MNDLICLRETWSHMATVSGFDQLFEALERCPQIRMLSFRVPPASHMVEQHNFLTRFWQKMRPTSTDGIQMVASSPFVERRHEIIAAKVVHQAGLDQDAMVMLSAGENQFGVEFMNASGSLRRRIAVCLHQPPSWLRAHWRDFSSLNGLGAIICLSRQQMEFVSGVTSTPVVLSRHGVRHDFFKPAEPPSATEPSRLIFVGGWLRDFDTLLAAMKLIWQELPETKLDCVIMRGAWNDPSLVELSHDHRVQFHADISPEALRNLYQQAMLLFLPQIDSVANNAIVEALASGLPIVSTWIGGVSEYVPESAGELCLPGDASAHAGAALRWLSDRDRLGEARLAAREYAETELDWKNIALNLVSELKKLSLC